MEFEEMKKIWDAQNNSPLYVIDEKALHNRIQAKKQQAGHITNFTELLLIVVNTAMGILILVMNSFKLKGSLSLYLLSGWMFITALYVLVNRINRIRSNNKFDRSIRSDLHHAISIASYQVRLSHLMRWNVLPILILSLLGIWEGGKSIWVAIGVLIVFVLAYYASGWEHNIYKSRKRDLEILQNKLESEVPS